jgi:hypothetical protein
MIRPDASVNARDGIVYIDESPALTVGDDGVTVLPAFTDRIRRGPLSPEDAVTLAAALEIAGELAARSAAPSGEPRP